MKELYVSFGVKNRKYNYYVFIENNKLVRKGVITIETEKLKDSKNAPALFGFKETIKQLKNLLYERDDIEKVVFEVSNSNLIRWVEKGYSTDELQDSFIEIMEMLNELPIVYNFHYVEFSKIKAYKYNVKNKKIDIADWDFEK